MITVRARQSVNVSQQANQPRSKRRTRKPAQREVEQLETRMLLSTCVDHDISLNSSDPTGRENPRLARRVHRLSADQFAGLSAGEIIYLTADQIRSIPGSEQFTDISSRARAALTTDQIRALDVQRVDIKHLSDDQICSLSVDQIKELHYRDFRQLHDGQARFLTPDQIATIPNAVWFARMSPETRADLGAGQVQALRVDRTGIGLLTEQQREFLSEKQIRGLGYVSFRFLNNTHITMLNARQLRSIPSGERFAQINQEARDSLRPGQIRALRIQRIGLGLLSESQREQLSVNQIQSLGFNQFRYLNRSQIVHLNADQIASVPNRETFEQISSDVRSALTADQIRAVKVHRCGIGWLTPEQVRFLAAKQIRQLDHEFFARLGPGQIRRLRPSQIAGIPDAEAMSSIPERSRRALTEIQISALQVERVGVEHLSRLQVRSLDMDRVQDLDYRSFPHLTAAQVSRLTDGQLGEIPDVWWFSLIPARSRAALSPEQLRSIRVGTIPLRLLTPDQLAGLPAGRIEVANDFLADVADLNYHDFRYLNVQQIRHLRPEQVAAIPDGWWLSRIPSEVREAMTADQVRALNVHNTGIGHLTVEQRTALTPAQVRSLHHYEFRYLSATQTPMLSPDQLASIPDSWWFSRMSESARAALTDDQVPHMNVADIGISGFTEAQVQALTSDQVQSLSKYQFRYLTAEQSIHLTEQQLQTIPDQWWFSRMSQEARAVLQSHQIQALNVSDVGLRYLTQSQIASLSRDQIRSLDYRDFAYLGPGQSPDLSQDQIASIPDAWWFSRISSAARAALTGTQIQALNVSQTGLRYLTNDQLQNLTPDQIQSLNYRDFHYLHSSQTHLLTPNQIATIPDSWWMSRINNESRQNFSPDQVQRLDTGNVSIRYLTPGQRGHLTVPQVQSLSYGDFRYVTAEQAVHLTAEQMSSIPNHWYFRRMSDEAQAVLSNEQMFSLRPHVFASVMGVSSNFSGLTELGHDEHGHEDPGHQHDPDLPHPDDPDKRQEHLALLALVPHEDATFVTIASGNWTDPAIWETGEVPTPDADVLVSGEHTVLFDAIYTDALHTVRIDGALEMSTEQDTQLMADTIVVDTTGTFRAGTATEPVESGIAARVVIADSGSIDTDWDPRLLSRGFISHGAVEIHGETVTPYSALAVDPLEGDTQLTLDVTPTNWRVGDRLVLTGTNPWHDEDEEFEIVALSGTVVTLDRALEHDHVTPAGHDLSVYVANMNRNVVFMSENVEMNERRGHVMFMHNANVQVHNAGFYGLGRTDKRNPANDAILDEHGNLIPNTGLNQRGRYAVHFHRAGSSEMNSPGVITGSAVVDSPGWGYVNHDSFAHMDNNVAFHVVGASFVTEFGNETGSFTNNLSIRTTGSGDGLESREDIFDFGHQGHGFWLQGPGVELVDNISVGNADAAFIFFTASSEAQFATANMDDPTLAAGREFVPVGAVPLKRVDGNVAFASKAGLETWFHLTHVGAGQSVIEDFTSWNIGRRAVHTPYTGRTTIKDATLIGNPARPSGTAFSRNDVTNNMTYQNVHVEGFEVGISVPVRRATVINGGYFEAIRAIEIHRARDTIRTVDINGDIQFADLSDAQLRGRQQYDIYLNGSISMKNRDIETYFSPDIVRLGTVRLDGHQVYYHIQAADFVPFSSDDVPDWIPPELLDKTNDELWQRYGIAPAGIVAPDDAVELERINGLVGTPSDYLPTLTLRSSKYTNELSDYLVEYLDADGNHIHDTQPVELREGWNLLTREVNGQTRTFFVFGDTEAPTFELHEDADLRVHPDGLRFGFVVRGTVFDNSFGHMSFHKRFNDLESREIHTRNDGSQFILLAFTIRDLAGNTTDVELELNLDSNAPLVPGTGQRDLPPRDLPTTLFELLEYYMITGQTEDMNDLDIHGIG